MNEWCSLLGDVLTFSAAICNHAWTYFPSAIRNALLLLRSHILIVCLLRMAPRSAFRDKWIARLRESGVIDFSALKSRFQSSCVVYVYLQLDLRRLTRFAKKARHSYVGSATCSFCKRHDSRLRKLKQIVQGQLVAAEPSLRYWFHTGNFDQFVGVPLFVDVCSRDVRIRELQIISKWQPILNFPFCKAISMKLLGIKIRCAQQARKQDTRPSRLRKRVRSSLSLKWFPLQAIAKAKTQDSLGCLWTVLHRLSGNTKDAFMCRPFSCVDLFRPFSFWRWTVLHRLSGSTKDAFHVQAFLLHRSVSAFQLLALFRLSKSLDEPWRSEVRGILSRIFLKQGVGTPVRNKALKLPLLAHASFSHNVKMWLRNLLTQFPSAVLPFAPAFVHCCGIFPHFN